MAVEKPKATVKHSQVLVQRQIKKTHPGGKKETTLDEQDEDLIEIHEFVTEPARVGVSYGRTINLGDFESLRVDVSVSVPCYKEEVKAAFDRAKKFCGDRMMEELDRMSRHRDNPFEIGLGGEKNG